MELVGRVEAIARRKGCTAGQLALAWLLAQGDDVVPIPGGQDGGCLDGRSGLLMGGWGARWLEDECCGKTCNSACPRLPPMQAPAARSTWLRMWGRLMWR